MAGSARHNGIIRSSSDLPAMRRATARLARGLQVYGTRGTDGRLASVQPYAAHRNTLILPPGVEQFSQTFRATVFRAEAPFYTSLGRKPQVSPSKAAGSALGAAYSSRLHLGTFKRTAMKASLLRAKSQELPRPKTALAGDWVHAAPAEPCLWRSQRPTASRTRSTIERQSVMHDCIVKAVAHARQLLVEQPERLLYELP